MNNNGTSKQKKKKILLTVVCIILALASLGFSIYYLVPSADINNTVENTFAFTNYSVDVNVNENAIVEVKEEMTAVFYSTIKRGFVRAIPLENTYSYTENGKTKTVTQSIEVFDLKHKNGKVLNYYYNDSWIYVNFGNPDGGDYLPADTPIDFNISYKMALFEE